MLSTRARVSAIATANSGDNSGSQYSSNSVTGTYTYSSDQYLLAGFNYGFGFDASAGRTSTQTNQLGNESVTESSGAMGVNHRANRIWLIGRASTLNLGMAQGASVQVSGPEQGSGTITHSLTSGISTHNLRGTTFVAMSASDSRSVVFHNLEKQGQAPDKPISAFQNISLSFSRNYYLNRFSDTAGELSYTSNRIDTNYANVRQVEVNSVSRATVHYRHSRLFTVYGMSLQSDLTYSNTQTKQGRPTEETTLHGGIFYTIGQLVTSLNLDVTKNAGSIPNYGLRFLATRSF